jgi:hypothetical protein
MPAIARARAARCPDAMAKPLLGQQGDLRMAGGNPSGLDPCGSAALVALGRGSGGELCEAGGGSPVDL